MGPRGKLIFKIATACMAVAILVIAVMIMIRGAGLSPDLDFGAGAYYYTDSPQLMDIASEEHYRTSVPTWVHIVLFLVWGWLMYRLWCWLDKK